MERLHPRSFEALVRLAEQGNQWALDGLVVMGKRGNVGAERAVQQIQHQAGKGHISFTPDKPTSVSRMFWGGLSRAMRGG